MAIPTRPRTRRRMLAATVVLACALTSAPPVPAAAAGLSVVDLICTGTGQVVFSPPLNYTTSSATVTLLLNNCFSPSGRVPKLRSAVLFGSNGEAHGCSPIGLTLGGTGTLSWNDGSTTNFQIKLSTDLARPPVDFAAVFTGGTLAGDKLTGIPLILTPSGLCGAGGARSLNFVLALAIATHPG